jgi:RNA polymerase sigma factor (sigma-70 family)
MERNNVKESACTFAGIFSMEPAKIIQNLYRTEFSKMVSVLCKYFGLPQIEVAEDLVSDTFLAAAESWKVTGVPENPAAWLHHVAKNKTKNWLKRDQIFEKKITADLKKNGAGSEEPDIDLSPQNIQDSQLQMMFAICHPAISPEAQIGLSLRILCGFGIEEIADAFLTNKETINKRLFRAKEKLREEKINMEIPDTSEMDERLETVLRTIYLLFNEGYYSVSQDQTLRRELCLEAMRLCQMLVANPSTDQPAVNALLSLMCFHASRFDARINDHGGMILYEDQDPVLWNQELISKGGYFMNRAAQGHKISKYHLEAGIAYWNTQKEDTHEKWESILQFYNHVLQLEYSPITALNRTYALYKADGKQAAIVAAEKLELSGNHFYFALLGTLYSGIDNRKSRECWKKALALAKTVADREAILVRIAVLAD